MNYTSSLNSKTAFLLPLANKVWGKVMFLHLSVSHSVHRGEGLLSLGGVFLRLFLQGMWSLGGCCLGMGVVLGGCCP